METQITYKGKVLRDCTHKELQEAVEIFMSQRDELDKILVRREDTSRLLNDLSKKQTKEQKWTIIILTAIIILLLIVNMLGR